MLRRLAGMLTRPRSTIREVFESDSDAAALMLVVAAAASRFLSDFRWKTVRALVHSEASRVAIIPAIAAVAVIASVALFYCFAWLVWLAGRLFEGRGSPARVRAALAWTFAPVIFALVYRLPLALFGPAKVIPRGVPDNWTGLLFILRDAVLLRQWAPELALAVVNLSINLWCFGLAIVAVSEAHRFSTWRSAAAVGFTLLLPLIAAAAFVIARTV